jgi:transcriptional regulator GlxA family with amidase domain
MGHGKVPQSVRAARAERIAMSDAATMVSMSERTFLRHFRQHFGVSPGAFRQAARVREIHVQRRAA